MRKTNKNSTVDNRKHLKDKVVLTPAERRAFNIKLTVMIVALLAAAIYLGIKL